MTAKNLQNWKIRLHSKGNSRDDHHDKQLLEEKHVYKEKQQRSQAITAAVEVAEGSVAMATINDKVAHFKAQMKVLNKREKTRQGG